MGNNIESKSTQNPNTERIAHAEKCARYYLKRKWSPIPIPSGGKRPRLTDWPNFDLTDDYIWPEPGVGIILGERSEGLIDIDLDCVEAIAAASTILPKTLYKFGRKSKPLSHYLYQVKDLVGQMPSKFTDPEDGEVLVEFRFSYYKNGKLNGLQTVFPPTIHPSGEIVTWSDKEVLSTNEPSEETYSDLSKSVKELVAICLVAKRWQSGSRHDLALAFGGFLAHADMEEQNATRLMQGICLAAGDPEVDDRVRALSDSYNKLEEGEPTSGSDRLSDLLSDKIVAKVQQLLDIKSSYDRENSTIDICEEPRPLLRPIEPSDPFPVDYLGEHLSEVVKAICEVVQVPTALATGSVLATASLAVQGFANIVLPISNGVEKPLSLFIVTVAQSSDRKSTADELVLKPICRREKELDANYRREELEFERTNEVYQTIKNEILKKRKGKINNPKDAIAELDSELSKLGKPPERPLFPYLIVQEPTYEALLQLYKSGLPSIGLFSAEGAQMLGGYSMRDERKSVTAAGLNALWDGYPLKRTRVLDGNYSLDGRRLALHLMIQPGVAAKLFNDAELRDIGLLSRMLITAPESLAGTRRFKEAPEWAILLLNQFEQIIYTLLSRPLPLKEGCRNILNPTALKLCPESRQIWIKFHDEIENEMGDGGRLEEIKGFAGKMPEQAARIAGILTLIDNIESHEVPSPFMESGCRISKYYANESLRLHRTGLLSPRLNEAQRLLDWLHHSQSESQISLSDIYQRGPNSIRDVKGARALVSILEEHGWLRRLPEGTKVKGKQRKEAWEVIFPENGDIEISSLQLC